MTALDDVARGGRRWRTFRRVLLVAVAPLVAFLVPIAGEALGVDLPWVVIVAVVVALCLMFFATQPALEQLGLWPENHFLERGMGLLLVVLPFIAGIATMDAMTG